jgi:hypothetical protein
MINLDEANENLLASYDQEINRLITMRENLRKAMGKSVDTPTPPAGGGHQETKEVPPTKKAKESDSDPDSVVINKVVTDTIFSQQVPFTLRELRVLVKRLHPKLEIPDQRFSNILWRQKDLKRLKLFKDMDGLKKYEVIR